MAARICAVPFSACQVAARCTIGVEKAQLTARQISETSPLDPLILQNTAPYELDPRPTSSIRVVGYHDAQA